MHTAETKAVSPAEAKSFFSGLESLPALVLAVSGGPDSTALMVLAARWRRALKINPNNKPKLFAITVDHGLRAESKAEAAAVARLARKLSIAHRTLRWTGKKPAAGLPQAARRARYRLLGEAARKLGAAHILTAHTRDDQAETVLIRMSRGSGVTGLAAMARVNSFPYPSPERGGSDRRRRSGVGSTFNQVTPSRRASLADLPLAGGGEELLVLRPLLEIPKSRLIATLRAAKIPFADDPSNRDPRFTRARLRGLMPALAHEGLDAGRLALLARRLRRADAAIEAAVDRARRELAVEMSAPPGIVMEARRFADLPAEIALRLIGRAVTQLGDEGPVELGKLEALQAALNAAQKAGQKAGKERFRRSLAGALVSLAAGQISVERAPPRRSMALTKRRPSQAKRPKSR